MAACYHRRPGKIKNTTKTYLGMVLDKQVQDTSPLVEVKDLRFGYGARQVLRGVNLSVPRGKVVAIMGGSGCGKTTLLRLIGGQLRAPGGPIRVFGEALHELDHDGLYRLRRRMGMLFQFGALFTDISVFENVAFPLREHHASC